MAWNKLSQEVKLKHYDNHGFFICPLCPFDALIYNTVYCPQCGLTLNWDKDLLKIEHVVRRAGLDVGGE